MNRVVVTGLGPVSSIGVGVGTYESSLRSGRSGVSRISCFDPSMYPQQLAGEVRDFRPETLLQRIDPTDWGRSSQFAATAARLAVEDAQLPLDRISPERVGVVVGTTSGESQAVYALTEHLVENDGFRNMHSAATLVRQIPAERLAHAISTELAIEGDSVTIATACSAGNYALGYAYDILAHGEADVMLAGGADSVSRQTFAGFLRLGAMSDTVCAPFDTDRSGILVGEGGAVLVLERLDHARDRGALPYAEFLGYGTNCDAHHMVAPLEESIADCMRLAHRNAGITPSDVDYICAHGTGTPTNDLTETRAIREVFGERLPPVSSIKSMLGHTMGAASAFGAIACALAVSRHFLPPTINYENPDPALGELDPVPNIARDCTVRVTQNDGFAFGGNNAITILGRVR
jgi:3-oxoacyl-[acyl-carrier-protein] synthase II